MKPRITARQREELEAIRELENDLGQPPHLWAGLAESNPTIKSLIRRGLIHWNTPKRGSRWGNRFRAASLTNRGRQAIS
jgi:hypothetical protein